MGRERHSGAAFPITYCIVPRDLARALHEPLRRHFAVHPQVDVIVEQRRLDRRHAGDRRVATDSQPTRVLPDRRAIRAVEGRRAGERRATLVAIDPLALPRRIASHAARLAFATRLEHSTQHAEDMDTARVVARFQAGDREAFAVLYRRYFARIYNYFQVSVRDPHTAEDLTQRVLMAVFEGLPRYERRPGVPFRHWLFVMVRHATLAALAKRQEAEVTDPVAISAHEPDAHTDESVSALDWLSDQELLLFVERLPVVQRQVLVMRYLFDLPYETIAATLDRTVVDVRSLHSRAVRFLRARLAAVGRRPAANRGQLRMRTWRKQPPVIGARRWALHA